MGRDKGHDCRKPPGTQRPRANCPHDNARRGETVECTVCDKVMGRICPDCDGMVS